MDTSDITKRIEMKKIARQVAKDEIDKYIGTAVIIGMVILIVYLSFKVIFAK